MEPPAAYPDGVRQPARPGHPPAARLSARLRRPAGLNSACYPMARTLHAMNMVGSPTPSPRLMTAASRLTLPGIGDWHWQRCSRWRALQAMIDAAHQTVSFDDAWAVNNRN